MTEPPKLWYWRRVIAVSLDFVAASLIFVLAFSAIAGTASDRFRLSGLGVTSSECRETKPSQAVLDAGSRTMPGIIWTKTTLCDGTSFGLVRDRIVQLSREERIRDNATQTSWASVAVDAAGNPVDPTYLDWLGILFFVAVSVLFVISPMQATPALRLFGLRLVASDGGRVGLAAALLRLVYGAAATALGLAIAFGVFWLVVTKGLTAWLLALVFLCLATAYAVWWRPFSVRPDLPHAPLHDILAGTRIVRVAPTPALDAATETER
ncbi:hypothetical protein ACWIGM_12395 [Bosea sp. NPDC055332]